MLEELTNDLKQIALAGVGAAVILAETSTAFVNECVKRGSQAVEQGREAAEKAAEKFAARAGRAQQEHQDQWLSKLTPEERDALRRRLDELDNKPEENEPDDLNVEADKNEEDTSSEE